MSASGSSTAPTPRVSMFAWISWPPSWNQRHPGTRGALRTAVRGSVGSAAAARLRGATGHRTRSCRRRQSAGARGRRAGRTGRDEHRRRPTACTQGNPISAGRGVRRQRHRANGAPQSRISPSHQHGGRVAQARADDVADHPLRSRIRVPHHCRLARPVDQRPSPCAGSVGQTRRRVWPAMPCRSTWPRGRFR